MHRYRSRPSLHPLIDRFFRMCTRPPPTRSIIHPIEPPYTQQPHQQPPPSSSPSFCADLLGWETLRLLPRDGRLLLAARGLRMLSFGLLAVVLVLYLKAAGLPESQIGLLFTLTLLGDGMFMWVCVVGMPRREGKGGRAFRGRTLTHTYMYTHTPNPPPPPFHTRTQFIKTAGVSLFMTTHADALGRRRMLRAGAVLKCATGAVFASSKNFYVLVAGTCVRAWCLCCVVCI